ncbi:unnamed protein product, partial [Closterium sp. NIES-54]
SLPPLPPSPALPCLPCVEGRQRAAPHSSSFPLTTAPMQTLHIDVKRQVPNALIPWIRAVRLQLSERFHKDLPVLRLHSDIGVMEVARTSMIHAAAPHFFLPFAVRYTAHQLNLWPHVSLPKTLPTLRWTGKVDDASVLRVWGSRAFVHDTSAEKLSSRTIPSVFLGFPPDAPGWQFYHPTSRRVFPSQDVTFDESVPFYRLFPYRSARPPPPPPFLAPSPPLVDPLPPKGPAPSGVSQVDPLPGTVPLEVAVDPGAAGGAASGGAEPRGAEPRGAEPGVVEPGGAESEGVRSRGAEPGGAEPGRAERGGAQLAGVESGGAEPAGVEPGGAEPAGVESGGDEPAGVEPGGAESGGTKPWGAASSGGPAGASPRLSPRLELVVPQQLREWFTQRTRLRSGAAGAGDPASGDTGAGGAGVTAGAGGAGGAAAAGFGGVRTWGNGAAGTGGAGGAGARGTGAGGAGAGGARAVDPRAGGTGAGGAGGTVAGGIVQPRLYFPASLVPPPSPYTEQTAGLTKRRKLASCPASRDCTGRRVPHPRPAPVPGTHAMELRPSSVPQRFHLPPPPESSLPTIPDPESNRARAASPTISRLLATGVTKPSFESLASPRTFSDAKTPFASNESFMVVYVDDILIFTPSSDLVKEVMLKLQDKFKCKALDDVSFYLGLHIERVVEKRCMQVHQRKYLEALAANFGQSEGHVATLFPSRFKCVKGPEEESVGEEERRRFHSLVGSLMYAAVNTRPDVAFDTGQLARVVECPNEEQVVAGMRVAKYLGQTPTVGLQYSAAAQRRQKGTDGVEPRRLFLTAFSDASYALEPEDMTSVRGFIFYVGRGPTAWESKKQVDQALSSVESEYMALFRAVREIVWQRRLLAELGEEQQGPTPLYCDSQGAIALAKNPVLHGSPST